MTSSTQIISESTPHKVSGTLGALTLGALGVVYGDIGTSPLYTLKTVLEWAGSAAPDVAYGSLSLIVWTLIITTSIKYVGLVMRADNDGEGGILALMARLALKGRQRPGLIAMGILGAALLYGDGAITPAISVLSALEGLKLPLPAVAPYILPLAVVVLIALFCLQHKGTAVIGRLFGPVMFTWFATIGILGAISVLEHPRILLALDPRYGVHYLTTHGFAGFTVLGAVFLSATGAEALYADMGHFGTRPIRFGWYSIVLPTLLLNYAGQAALVVTGIPEGGNPFFLLGPGWLQLPLVALATAATIIASQAIISGVFSMTRQAIQLGLSPRLNVTQTSATGYGQIYVASINWLLMIFTIGLTLAFGSSDRLAAAFGVAVSLTMLLTTVLMYQMMREQWKWTPAVAIGVAGALALVDLSFVSANLTKVADGGWVPLVAAAIVFLLMESWRTGRTEMLTELERVTAPLAQFVQSMTSEPKVEGTAVYLSRRDDAVPIAMLHNVEHYHVLHKCNVILHVETEQVPRVPESERASVTDLGNGFYRILLHYGFMQHPNIPAALESCTIGGRRFDCTQTSFFLSRVAIVKAGAGNRRLQPILRRLFCWMQRNAADATEFFRIPPNRIVEMGARVEL
ncbi:MAG: potassium transporter Kup [Steroidobacteraceae bacterium]